MANGSGSPSKRAALLRVIMRIKSRLRGKDVWSSTELNIMLDAELKKVLYEEDL